MLDLIEDVRAHIAACCREAGEPTPEFSDEQISSALALERGRAADLVTFGRGVEGAVCANCEFVTRKDGGDYCRNEHVDQPLPDGRDRQCCSFWDRPGTRRRWQGGSVREGFDPSEPRDEEGKWTSGGGSQGRQKSRESLDSADIEGHEVNLQTWKKLSGVTDAVEAGHVDAGKANEAIKSALAAWDDHWANAEKILRDAGADTSSLASLREKAGAAIGKKAFAYQNQIGKVAEAHAALKELAASEPKEPKEPEDIPTPPEPDAEADSPEYAAWEKESAKIDDENERRQAAFDRSYERWGADYERWDTRHTRASDKLDGETDKLKDRLDDLSDTIDDHHEALGKAATSLETVLRQHLDRSDDSEDQEPEEPEAPDEVWESFDPSEPRDEEGKWTSGGGGTSHPGAAHGSTVRVKAIKKRAWDGTPVPLKTQLTKQETGRVGEAVLIAYLKSQGFHDAQPMNSGKTNFPVDALEDHRPTEIKAGLASNTRKAQQWRLTFSKESAAEKAKYEKMTPEERTKYNAMKQQRIHERKQKVIEQLEKETGQKVHPRTMTVIINPDTQTADIYAFDGFHDRIDWQSDMARKGYLGSVKYDHGH